MINGSTVDVKHHLPVRRLDTLMKAEPDLTATSEWMFTALGRCEERPSHGHRLTGIPEHFHSTAIQLTTLGLANINTKGKK